MKKAPVWGLDFRLGYQFVYQVGLTDSSGFCSFSQPFQDLRFNPKVGLNAPGWDVPLFPVLAGFAPRVFSRSAARHLDRPRSKM